MEASSSRASSALDQPPSGDPHQSSKLVLANICIVNVLLRIFVLVFILVILAHELFILILVVLLSIPASVDFLQELSIFVHLSRNSVKLCLHIHNVSVSHGVAGSCASCTSFGFFSVSSIFIILLAVSAHVSILDHV